MTYEEYMKSESWAVKRVQRLSIDDHRCRMCDHDGSSYRLEVHHRPSSYGRIPDESVEHDLTVLCSRCHELITSAIREDRYGLRMLPVGAIESAIHVRQEISYGMANSEIQIDIRLSATDAQRGNGESAQQVGEVDETDFVQARQDRR